MEYYVERWTPIANETLATAHWWECYDRAMGIAFTRRCGVELSYLTDGDVTFAATTRVGFGHIREEHP